MLRPIERGSGLPNVLTALIVSFNSSAMFVYLYTQQDEVLALKETSLQK